MASRRRVGGHRAADLRDAQDSPFTEPSADRDQWSPPVSDSPPRRADRGRHRDTAGARVPRRIPRPVIVLVAVAVLLVGATMIYRGTRTFHAHAAPLPAKQFTVDPHHLPPVPTDAPTDTGRHGKGQPATPTVCHTKPHSDYVVIARLCVNAEIFPTERETNGDLVIPTDVQHVGLWGQPITTITAGKPTVGNVGTTLIAGHIDNADQGAGAFYAIHETEPGDVVYTSDAAGHAVRWRVVALQVVVKAKLPAAVFNGRSGPRRLVLVTCGGPIVYSSYGNYYRDNVIVTAIPG